MNRGDEILEDNKKCLLVNVKTALDVCSIGRTTLYKLIAARKIETVAIGRRRLIVYASLEALVAGAVRS